MTTTSPPPAIVVDYANEDGNHPPDFAAAHAAGCRAAYARQAEGVIIDATPQRDRAAAAAAGIPFGAFILPMYPRPSHTVASPEMQVAAFAGAYGDRVRGELPVALDIEIPGGRASTSLSAAAAVEWITRVHAALAARYGTVVAYTSSRVWTEDLGDLDAPALRGCPLWIKTGYFWARLRHWDLTHYTSITTTPKPWASKLAGPLAMHQIQGDALGFPGFSASVDISITTDDAIAALVAS